MAHAIIKTDLLRGTVNPAYLRSGQFLNGETPADIDNANIVHIGGFIDGKRDVYKLTAPTESDTLSTIGVMAGDELMADSSKRNLNEYINIKDIPARVYMLDVGDIFSATSEAFEGAPQKDKYVNINPGKTTMLVSDTLTKSTIGQIIAVEIVGTSTYYVVGITDVKPTE